MYSSSGKDLQSNFMTNSTTPAVAGQPCTDTACIFYAIVNAIIVVLGIFGNGLVIWIVGFKIKKSVNSTWYLSLAVSDFLFLTTLPFSIVDLVINEWIFGHFMCKLMYFFLSLYMFSSIFVLVVISVDRCIVVMFPVWARNSRTIRKASVMVVQAWIISAALSVSGAIYRDIKGQYTNKKIMCFYRYIHKDYIGIVLSRFILGFVSPFLVIIICYVLTIRKLRTKSTTRSMKPFKVMTVLIVVFFICWLPYDIFNLLEQNLEYDNYINIIYNGQIISSTLAHANSFLNPFLYAFMGKEVKRTCYALLSKIENAVEG